MDFIVHPGPVFPEGTTVGLYPATNWPASTLQPRGAPLGAATASEDVTDGALTFTGIDAGDYWAVAQVGTPYQYVRVSARAPSVGGDIEPSTNEGDVLTTQGGVVVWAAPSGGGGGLPNGDDGFIRGHVAQSGADPTGEGFTVELADDAYTITFDQPFAAIDPEGSGLPDFAVVVTPEQGPSTIVTDTSVEMLQDGDTGTVYDRVVVRFKGGNFLVEPGPAQRGFSFMAVGKLAA